MRGKTEIGSCGREGGRGKGGDSGKGKKGRGKESEKQGKAEQDSS